jgi:SET domain-containing protein
MPTNHSLPEIAPQSKNDPRLEARPSPIHGMGVFATADIKKGEILMVWGGTFFTIEDIQAGRAMEHSYCTIAESVILGHTVEQGNSVDDFTNHSCDPNAWMVNEITIAARRDIKSGEEVTADLAMWWDPDDDSTPPWECHCGTPQCRKIFTSRDWRRPELHERYGDHFLPYINERIKQLRETKNEKHK